MVEEHEELHFLLDTTLLVHLARLLASTMCSRPKGGDLSPSSLDSLRMCVREALDIVRQRCEAELDFDAILAVTSIQASLRPLTRAQTQDHPVPSTASSTPPSQHGM